MNSLEGGPSQTPEQPKSSDFSSKGETDERRIPQRVEFSMVPEGFWCEYELSIQGRRELGTKESFTGHDMLDILAFGALPSVRYDDEESDEMDNDND